MTDFTPFSDHVFAILHGVELCLRIWPAASTNSSPCPWMLWIHGGSTVAGSPFLIPPWVVPGFTSRGVHLISTSYRLSPHVRLTDQVEDCKAAHDWCVAHLPEILGLDKVELDRWGVAGESAGARLSLLLPFRVTPSPKVVVDLYGWSGFLDSQLEDPTVTIDQSWPDNYPSWESMLEESNCHDASRAIIHAPYSLSETNEDIQRAWQDPSFCWTDRITRQTAMMKFTRLTNSKTYHLLRLDQVKGGIKERQQHSEGMSTLHLLNKVASYPPTAVLHGLKDTIIPAKMSEMLVEKLRNRGDVPVLDLWDEEGDHGFDHSPHICTPSTPGYDRFITPTLDFVEKHLRQ